MLALTIEIPNKGDYKSMEVVGIPVLITRDKDNLIINGRNENFYSDQIPIIKDFNKDHRIAMAFYVLSSVSRKRIQINDFNCTNVSFPNFLKTINNLKSEKFKKIINHS